jgi:penicillin-binding protein 1C
VRAVDGRAAAPPVPERLISERAAFWITDILSDADARAYIFGRGGSLEFPFPVAAKTGTSQAYHDNWAIGYTRDVTVGVWVGNFDRSPLRNSSGVTGAGPIFHDVMIAAVERARGRLPLDDARPIVEPPADLRRVTLCAESGLTPNAWCPTRVVEWLPLDVTPKECDWHRETAAGVTTAYPEQYRQWVQGEGGVFHGLPADRAHSSPSRPAVAKVMETTADASRLTITAPLAGALYLIDPTLRSEFQTLPLRARGASPGVLEWFVDGHSVGRVDPDDAVRWPLERGRHDISARDASGHTAETTVVVK